MVGTEPHMTSAAVNERAENLCLACGLCCDGTIFSDVTLESEDSRDDLVATGLTFRIHSDGSERFDLPCLCHVGGPCVIYAQRPSRCRRFRCDLLKAVEAGGIAPAEARNVVRQALDLRDGFREELARVDPTVARTPVPVLWHRLNLAMVGDDANSARERYSRTLLQLFALRTYIQRHFRKKFTIT